ncbi:Predicted metalloprotease, contains C-terminal PDZ domain [Luteibacter sp. UNC138MFCol5.1]|uniref:M61 family metallopeptidase n=1 Tax=Luteibacter sp. UNC138MFCol5.1 TaxID=1502774 RepID=UPI0008CEF99F|nr:M61 family metallopeptidase [Luteibacter sp. UNC138MFCol5.1]SEO86139.1 Predicted metalloprotease, contains C-terminal PDZ domain [Luteibacter sp. UNC138MFCol5.1]
MRHPFRRATLAAAVAAAMALSVPQARAADLPVAADQPYPGNLTLHVDLSDASRHLYHVRESIPVKPGHAILYYPKWIPGVHAPSGPLSNVAGFIVTGNGKRIPWRRDLKEMYAFHVDVPEGVDKLDLTFDYLAPATPNYIPLSFNEVAFYPAGYYTSQITVQPTLKLPAGWKFASALETASQSGDEVSFRPVSFENLVDSPVMTGKYFTRIDLAPGQPTQVHLNITGDTAAGVKATEDQIAKQRALIVQANKLFGAHHYDHYDFLLVTSDHTGHFGLEHHQSSDDRLFANFLTDPDANAAAGTLLPHEYIHSWNGKFRRPADLWTPTFTEPMQDDLLWVYEGMTDYWAGVLTARSGIWTTEQWRDSLAGIAADMSARTGREWRSLQDTADGIPLSSRGTTGWTNLRRSSDYYPEGQLLWLDVDTKIRDLSGGKHTLDEFARAFFGMDNGSYKPKTYTFDDVISTLNGVQPYDWATFLRQRLDYTGDTLPEHGIEGGGWKLVYDDKPTAFAKTAEKIRKTVNFAYSLGIQVSDKGVVTDAQWEGISAKAGLVPGVTIVAVDGKDYSGQVLKDAVTAAKSTTAPIEFLIKDIEEYRTVKVDYHGGLKYPHLVRGEGKDLIGAIATPKK